MDLLVLSNIVRQIASHGPIRDHINHEDWTDFVKAHDKMLDEEDAKTTAKKEVPSKLVAPPAKG